MNMERILIIEDDEFISNILRYYLEQDGKYEVDCAATGGEGFSKAQRGFDLILLDIMLPDVNGVDLCNRLRSWYTMPIIFISALDDTDTIVKALAAGGDDFLVKPFENEILLAKIEANLRRASMMANQKFEEKTIRIKGVELDPLHSKLLIDGEEIRLPGMEYKIMYCLMQQPGHYFTARELYEIIWGNEYVGDPRTVQVHIHNLRKKIEKDPANPQYILNEWGKGYCFTEY